VANKSQDVLNQELQMKREAVNHAEAELWQAGSDSDEGFPGGHRKWGQQLPFQYKRRPRTDKSRTKSRYDLQAAVEKAYQELRKAQEAATRGPAPWGMKESRRE